MDGNKGEELMKTIKYILLVTAVLSALSCAKDVIPEGLQQEENKKPESNLVYKTFSASADTETDDVTPTAQQIQTKVFYDSEKKATKWKVGDEIMVITATGNQIKDENYGRFTVTQVSDDGMNATFEGLIEDADRYYAIYPASAYVGNDLANPTNETKGGRLYVNIPYEQTAVEGSFDPKAFVSIGTNDGNRFSFKNLCSVVKFNLKDATNVKSIRFTMPGNTNLAGIGNVYLTNLKQHTWNDPFTGREAFDKIILNAPDGGFKSGVDYYFTLRPYTQSNTEYSGIKLYVEYNDMVKLRSGEDVFNTYRNIVHRLGTLDKDETLAPISPYDAYNLGFDLTIDGKTINHSTYGNATLIDTDTQLSTVSTKVYFVNPNAQLTYTHGANVKSLVIIGNDRNFKSKLIATNQFRLEPSGDNDILLFYNMDIKGGTNNFLTIYADGTFKTIAFVDSKIDMGIDKKPIYYMSNASRLIDTFTMSGCDFVVSGNTQSIIQFGGSSISTYNNFIFRNNIFYNETENGAAEFNIIKNGGSTPVGEIILEQNTFANVYPVTSLNKPSPYFTLKSVETYTVNDNLFYLDKYNEQYGNIGSYMLTCVPTNVNIGENMLYTDMYNQTLQVYKEGDYYIPCTITPEDVVQGTVDLTIPTIVPSAQYGARR